MRKIKMGFVNFIYLFLVTFSNSTKIFKWDIDDLEQVFCQNSIKKFNEQKDGFEQTREEANTFTKTKNKARSKLAIWPWEYNDSFEGECIEEGCQDSEVKEFCSRQSMNFGDENENAKLLKHRMERIEFCDKHVDKRVNATKQINLKRKKVETTNVKDWQKELSPERLFRGWWEELKKAYKRFCLQDKSDCARSCDWKHGTCNLYQDEHGERDEKGEAPWRYRCECDPGYGPSWVPNKQDETQYLCKNKIEQDANAAACSTLNIFDNNGDVIPITASYLRDVTFQNHTESRQQNDKKIRKKRMVGQYSVNSEPQLFPAAVDIFHSTVSLKKTTRKDQDKPRSEKTYAHRCGGTLVRRNSVKSGTNVVVTAAHCFCGKYEIGDDGKPQPDKYFVRIGLIDNKRALNVVKANENGDIADEDKQKYVDVLVKDVKLKNPRYLKELCEDPSNSGLDDVAVMYLDGSIPWPNQVMDHVKPACNYAFHEEIPNIGIGNQNCFVSGWGKANTGSGGLGISENLKFTRVTVLDATECADNMPGDDFLNEIVTNRQKDSAGEWPIICATGVRLDSSSNKYSNTCGGDSGGGLYCFDPEDETKYYLMGVLHGGNAECTEDSYMYFSNNRHSSYRTLMNFEN